MKKTLSILLGVSMMVLATSCGNNESTEVSDEETMASSEQYEVGANQAGEVEPSFFGEEISDRNPMPADELFAALAKSDTVDNIIVSGKIESCCQKKGCWMKVKLAEDKEVFVKFKDYGFFMPLDCSGSTVVMEGKAYAETVSVEDLKHYAEDAGKTKEEIAAITKPETKYSFLAQGTMLTDYVPTDRTPPTDEDEE